ncbi:MAG: serine hydrolase [Candidatus Micrarchaeota archaeon]|nr:serine hydrolase [Candidatus Micrarchaeota archaeon]
MPVSTRREFLSTLLNLGKATAGVSLLGGVATAEARKPPKSNYVSEVDRRVHERIAELRRQGTLSPNDKTSVLVYGLQSDKHFVRVNIDEQHMAASLIKPFVMLAAYHKISRGKRPYGTFESDLNAMIVHSDNSATNRVMKFVGGPSACHKIIRKYGFDKTRVSEYIPAGGRTYRNKTSARNLSALMWKLHNRNLINSRYSERMLEHLNHYATSRLASLQGPLEIDELAGKTGFVGGLNGEATRVTYSTGSGARHYTFVAMVENTRMRHASPVKKQQWGKTTSGVIRSIFKAVHEQMIAP